jgi:hypothetical protein
MMTFGSPPALRYDTETNLLSIKIRKPDNDKPIIEDLVDQFQHVKNVNVALSGGIDSQFALRVACELDVPVKAYTYVSMWEGAVINADDVLTAELIAEKQNVELVKVYMDLKEFFDTNKHIEYGKKYATKSPQVAFHLYFIEKTFKDVKGTLFLGGEVPMMVKNSSEDEGPMDIAGLNSGFFMATTSGYRRLCKKHNIDLVKDLLFYTPEIIYKSLYTSINIAREKQKHCEWKEEYMVNMFPHKLKHEIYEDIIPGGINPLTKNTGFEKVKKHLASQTGIYNQFDLLYRKPLEHIFNTNQKQSVDGGMVTGSVKYIAKKLPQELTKEYRQAIDENDSQCVYEYYFDF